MAKKLDGNMHIKQVRIWKETIVNILNIQVSPGEEGKHRRITKARW
jgi:hypothetical protein